MPDFLVEGRIYYFLDFSCRVENIEGPEAEAVWEERATKTSIDVDQLQLDTTRVRSVTTIKTEDADLLCPHCGAGSDVYDSRYCENCGCYRA